MGLLVDRTGMRYGNLVVLRRDDTSFPASNGKRVSWVCKCDCGNEVSRNGHELGSGDTKSCGCQRRALIGGLRRSHGMTRTPTYRSWQAMKDRCSKPKNDRFAAYGGRGIAVCENWTKSFDAFFADMGERPSGMTLDRIDANKNYTPDNCRWASVATQANNKSTNVTWNGESVSIKSLASKIGVPRTSLNKLIKRGMAVEDAVAHAVARRKST